MTSHHPTLKAIETRYRGYRFRSRLEARWAVFFDTLGLEWRYEPEGYELPTGWYLPDFLLPGLGMFIEIKPNKSPPLYEAGLFGDQIPYRREERLMGELCAASRKLGCVMYGDPREVFSRVPLSERMWTAHAGAHTPIEVVLWSDLAFLDNKAADYRRNPEFIDAVLASRAARFEHGEG